MRSAFNPSRRAAADIACTALRLSAFVRWSMKMTFDSPFHAMEREITLADAHDLDPQEAQEWLDALSAIQGHRGSGRAEFIVNALIEAARKDDVGIQQTLTTPYRNTIPASQQPALPGDRAIEHKLRSIIRWNAPI